MIVHPPVYAVVEIMSDLTAPLYLCFDGRDVCSPRNWDAMLPAGTPAKTRYASEIPTQKWVSWYCVLSANFRVTYR